MANNFLGKSELYKCSTLLSINHGIKRHLQGSERDIDIVNGPQFRESDRITTAMRESLKRQGKGGTDPKIPMCDADLVKMYAYLDTNHPEKLQVFADLVLHLARRGRENLWTLKRTDFEILTDGECQR